MAAIYRTSLATAIAGEDAEEAASKAGANAVLRRPLVPEQLEHWLVKLLDVPRRSRIRVPVRGQVVAVPRTADAARFYGLTRNISVNGLVGGPPINLGLADKIGADGYGVDAPAAVEQARGFVSG